VIESFWELKETIPIKQNSHNDRITITTPMTSFKLAMGH
jgi:hypothetical protein